MKIQQQQWLHQDVLEEMEVTSWMDLDDLEMEVTSRMDLDDLEPVEDWFQCL